MKTKIYTIPVKIVETYTATIVVKATSSKQAKAIAEKEYQDNDYLYEKITDNRDDIRTTMGKPSVVPEDQVQRTLNMFLTTDSCYEK